MPQSSERKSPLSAHRAFVVHFRQRTDIEHGPIEGRVTHVVSGQSEHFASLEELLAFMAQILTSEKAKPSDER